MRLEENSEQGNAVCGSLLAGLQWWCVCGRLCTCAVAAKNLTVPLDTKFMNHSIKTVLISSLGDCIETSRSEAYLHPNGELVTSNTLLVTSWDYDPDKGSALINKMQGGAYRPCHVTYSLLIEMCSPLLYVEIRTWQFSDHPSYYNNPSLVDLTAYTKNCVFVPTNPLSHTCRLAFLHRCAP